MSDRDREALVGGVDVVEVVEVDGDGDYGGSARRLSRRATESVCCDVVLDARTSEADGGWMRRGKMLLSFLVVVFGGGLEGAAELYSFPKKHVTVAIRTVSPLKPRRRPNESAKKIKRVVRLSISRQR